MEAVASMEKAPGVNPRPGRVPEQELLTPETRSRDGDGAAEVFLEYWLEYLGFSRKDEYIGEGPASVEARGLLTTWRRGRRWGRATRW